MQSNVQVLVGTSKQRIEAMTTTSIIDGLHTRLATVQAARNTNPLPSEHLTATADLAIRASLTLMPFSAIVWLFVAC